MKSSFLSRGTEGPILLDLALSVRFPLEACSYDGIKSNNLVVDFPLSVSILKKQRSSPCSLYFNKSM